VYRYIGTRFEVDYDLLRHNLILNYPHWAKFLVDIDAIEKVMDYLILSPPRNEKSH
jgi:hypothetical protein